MTSRDDEMSPTPIYYIQPQDSPWSQDPKGRIVDTLQSDWALYSNLIGSSTVILPTMVELSVASMAKRKSRAWMPEIKNIWKAFSSDDQRNVSSARAYVAHVICLGENEGLGRLLLHDFAAIVELKRPSITLPEDEVDNLSYSDLVGMIARPSELDRRIKAGR